MSSDGGQDPRSELARLYPPLAPALHAWACLRLRPEDRPRLAPEDLTQEVWLRAFTVFGAFDPARMMFRAWLSAGAKNVLLEARKRARRAGPERVTEQSGALARSRADDTGLRRAGSAVSGSGRWRQGRESVGRTPGACPACVPLKGGLTRNCENEWKRGIGDRRRASIRACSTAAAQPRRAKASQGPGEPVPEGYRADVEVDQLIERLRPLLTRESRIAAAWLFGSAARGELRADSDVDVGVVFARGMSAHDRQHVLADLASRLEAATAPRTLDLVDLEDQGHVFVHRALRDGKRIVVNDEERRVDFESDALVWYLDFKPTWDIAAREQQDGMRRWLRPLLRR
jgi:predicted nucleotidyltransferase